MRTMATKVARQLCDLLNIKGIKTESDFVLRPIDEILRDSWYVGKTKQCGHTDCMHVNISYDYFNVYGFFAILEDGKIMTGGNCMISDAFTAIDWSIEGGEFIASKPELYDIYEQDDDVCIITSLKGITEFVDRIKFIEDDEN